LWQLEASEVGWVFGALPLDGPRALSIEFISWQFLPPKLPISLV
jgi:hypothetical protein